MIPRRFGFLLAAIALPVLPLTVAAEHSAPFASSDRCIACHNGLLTQDGEDMSIGRNWQSSMMANAARDPYWQASVRRETLDHPAAAAAIEHECATCHMPMARYVAHLEGRHQPVLGRIPQTTAATGDPMAVDGVSCTVCHRIVPEGLGKPSSFSGHFKIGTEGSAEVFGPYEITAGRAKIMRSATGFQPATADHVGSAELCASCHTLITNSLGPDGSVTGELPEQVPYLEWQHGAYTGVRDCISCHMPEVDEPLAISSVLGEPREAVSRHVFRGGNFLVPQMLAAHGDRLGGTADPTQFEETIEATRIHLRDEAAAVSIKGVEIVGSTLGFEVVVENYAGHKLPTAYPSRRAWLHVSVTDSRGQVVFESGALRDDGSIAGNDNDESPARFEPHYREIDRPSQVQIYEPILAAPDGTVTTGLLTAVRYAKDNRLLPDGFDKATAGSLIAVHGAATDDPDFKDGGDRVRYRIDLGGSEPPLDVRAELLYQPIGFRWAGNLRGHDTIETDRFVGYYGELAKESAASLAQDDAEAGR